MGTGSYQKHINGSGWEDKSLENSLRSKNQIEITCIVEEGERIPFSLGKALTSKPKLMEDDAIFLSLKMASMSRMD